MKVEIVPYEDCADELNQLCVVCKMRSLCEKSKHGLTRKCVVKKHVYELAKRKYLKLVCEGEDK